jgi:hypothetical protein
MPMVTAISFTLDIWRGQYPLDILLPCSQPREQTTLHLLGSILLPHKAEHLLCVVNEVREPASA